MSRSGRCWLSIDDPTRVAGNGIVIVEGDPAACGWSGTWVDDPDGPGGNLPPVAIDGTVPVTYETTVTFTLATYSSDPDGDPLSWSILASSQLQVSDLDGFDPSTGQVTWTPPAGVADDEFHLDFRVQDPDGAFDEARVRLLIGPPPGIGGLAVTVTCTDPVDGDQTVPYNQNASCVAVPSDPSVSTFVWSAPDAEPFSCADQGTCDITRSSPGPVTVTVTVTDLAGVSASDSDTVTFVAVPPVVSLTCDTDVSYVDTGWCTATATDLNGDPLTYLWTIDDSASETTVTSPVCPSQATCGVAVAGPTDDPSTGTVGAPIGVSVQVTDGSTAPVSDSGQIRFVNLPPSTPQVLCGPAQPYGTDTTCTVSGGVDPEGGAVTWSWTMTSDDAAGLGDVPAPATCGDVTSCTFTHPNPVDTVTVTATVTDPAGESASGSTTTVFLNTPPSLGPVSCTGPHPYSQDTTCSVAADPDPEGDDGSYLWGWSQPDGSPTVCTPAAGPSSTCTFTRTTPGSVTTTVTVTDRWGASTSRTGTAVFVNEAPAVTVTCDRTSTNKVGDPTATCTASSPDPGPLTYDWSGSDDELGLDGCVASSCVVSPTGVTGGFVPRVTVTDPYGETGDDDGPVVQVVDDPSTVTVSGCSVPTGSWCTVSVTVNDPDDAAASVTWPTSGAGWSVPGDTDQQACDGSIVADGVDTASCQYRRDVAGSIPVDVGVAAGSNATTASGTATFTNRGPSVGDASCSVPQGQTCTVNVPWSDPEGGTLSFTFPNFSGGVSNKTSGECDGVDAASPRSCGYVWSGSSRSEGYGPVTAAVTGCDADGACNSGQVTVQWTPLPNDDDPVAVIECTDGTQTSQTALTNVPSGRPVTCTLLSESDTDGISHHTWQVSGTPSTCNAGGGGTGLAGEHMTCGLSSSDSSTTVQVEVRDLYCGTPLCVAGDGSRASLSNPVTIDWDPPAAGAGCTTGITGSLWNKAGDPNAGTWFADVRALFTTNCAGSARWTYLSVSNASPGPWSQANQFSDTTPIPGQYLTSPGNTLGVVRANGQLSCSTNYARVTLKATTQFTWGTRTSYSTVRSIYVGRPNSGCDGSGGGGGVPPPGMG